MTDRAPLVVRVHGAISALRSAPSVAVLTVRTAWKVARAALSTAYHSSVLACLVRREAARAPAPPGVTPSSTPVPVLQAPAPVVEEVRPAFVRGVEFGHLGPLPTITRTDWPDGGARAITARGLERVS